MTPRTHDADAVERAALRWPDAPALEGVHRTFTYGELNHEVEVLAGALSRLRAAPPEGSPGGRLALVLENRLDTALLVHAGFRAGFTVAPLSPSLTPEELSAAFSALDPLVVVCDDATEGRVRGAGSRIDEDRRDGNRSRIVSTAETGSLIEAPDRGTGATGDVGDDGERDRGDGTADRVGAGDADPGYVVWTSGSSGRPRGVLLTSASLTAVADGSARRLGLGPSDRWLTTLSLGHVGGLATVLRAARTGATLVIRDSFDAAELVGLAVEGRVTHASLVPLMLRRVLARGRGEPSPPELRCLLVGGAHAPPELVEKAVGLGYPVALTYGMTETSSQAATAAPEKVRRKPHTVGTPLPGVDLRIADDGEIRVRGPTLAAGYVGAGAARGGNDKGDSPPNSAADGLLPLDLDEDGWYRTGDLGRWDGDGDLVVAGRLSSRIITGGVTVDPAEVEEAPRSLPEVADAVVVGVPDEEWGERVSAVLVPEAWEKKSDAALPDSEAAADPHAVLLKKVDREMRRRLSGPKRPRLLRILSALPRTPSGKVDRAEVRAVLEEWMGE
ncbi:MAG: class I adenylate-forming enzyme family protein [bacterium]